MAFVLTWAENIVYTIHIRFCDFFSLKYFQITTNLGRADLVVRHKDKIWVLELKVAYAGENPEKKAEKAYRQMIAKHYAKPFPDAVCIAMVIDDTVRQITHFRKRGERVTFLNHLF